ncbi:acyltransferase [Mycolicibacterium novocastrense]|nr:acyltransferase family protein [Mycolicibacterium novocastrense]KUH75824.1 acyltransferase [Mycolicibacterium novocastrense]KUH78454.1 acyltransferase [Mycolicibacterium novocastrense]KUH79878.1 acyltransferase [Mycolicibacterium novocastrense]
MEGLRAVAVVAVVLFHASIPGIDGGYVGVDVFFVISGFLITGLLWRELGSTGTVRLRRFFGARARRLLPASALVGIVTTLSSAILLPPLLADAIYIDGIASALYISNFWFFLQASDYFASETDPSPFLHYWSLGVEEQFYLVWPAIIICTAWVVRRIRRLNTSQVSTAKTPYIVLLAVVGAASLAGSIVVTRIWPTAAFYLLPMRAWELAVGGLVALTVAQWRRLPLRVAALAGWFGIAITLFACNRFDAATPFPGAAALIPVLGTALVIGAGCAASDRGVGRVLSMRPMRALGEVSYSWYLWHWPVLVLAPAVVGHSLGLAGRLAAVLVSLCLAALTLRFIENPLRFKPVVRQSAARSLALGGAATAMAVCVAVVLLVSMPVPVGRGPATKPLALSAEPSPAGGNAALYEVDVQDLFAQVRAAVAASSQLEMVPSNLEPPLAEAGAEKADMLLNGCMRNVVEVGHPECTTGVTTSASTVALVGDSNAAMWGRAFESIALERRWRLETLTKAGCPLLDLRFTEPQLRRQYTECEQWRDEILTRLQAEPPRLVVLSVSRLYKANEFRSYDTAWFESLTRLVRQLRATGSKVLVLGPIPDPGTVVPVCLSGHLDEVSACSAPRDAAVNESGIAAETASTEAGGGHYADITALFCTVTRCPPIVGNALVYLDQFHLTLEYSRLLAPVIGALSDRALAGA